MFESWGLKSITWKIGELWWLFFYICTRKISTVIGLLKIETIIRMKHVLFQIKCWNFKENKKQHWSATLQLIGGMTLSHPASTNIPKTAPHNTESNWTFISRWNVRKQPERLTQFSPTVTPWDLDLNNIFGWMLNTMNGMCGMIDLPPPASFPLDDLCGLTISLIESICLCKVFYFA